MPEHFHILLTPSDETTIKKAVQMIKGGSARQMGLEMAHRDPIWHRGFHDRWIRDVDQFRNATTYIEQNPVRAGLAERPEDYPWSSANGEIKLDSSRFD